MRRRVVARLILAVVVFPLARSYAAILQRDGEAPDAIDARVSVLPRRWKDDVRELPHVDGDRGAFPLSTVGC